MRAAPNGARLLEANMRLGDTPEDFRVDEVPLYRASGEGDHTFVRIEKRLRNTEEVARDLARAARVAPRDIGYAGRKDRCAVTTQWFSVPKLDPADALALELRGARVLEAARHPHKLRTGQLRENRFELVLRDVDPESFARCREWLALARERGFANRFGGQRFGRDGANVARARELLMGASVHVDRRTARFLISALQAAVFNAVLDARLRPPHELECGDVAVRHESGGLFVVEDPELEAPRAAAFEISPTGPIFGTRSLEPAGAVKQRERAVLAEYGVDLERLVPPRGIRLRGARRALRVRPEDASASYGEGRMRLRFGLPPGSYATVFVEALLAHSFVPRAE
jgi:tRNA pseudouridine13 synthase